MQLVALANFHFGTGNAAEILQRGDRFAAQGNGIMNAREVGANYLRDRYACIPEDADKMLAKTQPGWDWAQAEVARMNKLRRS